jgi:hypothetical protein
MIAPHRVERLLADILHHSNIAACSIRAGEPNLDAVMLARAAAKAIHHGLGYSQQDTLDYVEVYETMLELVSDTYPVLPEVPD